jgi:hypothetical protein
MAASKNWLFPLIMLLCSSLFVDASLLGGVIASSVSSILANSTASCKCHAKLYRLRLTAPQQSLSLSQRLSAVGAMALVRSHPGAVSLRVRFTRAMSHTVVSTTTVVTSSISGSRTSTSVWSSAISPPAVSPCLTSLKLMMGSTGCAG